MRARSVRAVPRGEVVVHGERLPQFKVRIGSILGSASAVKVIPAAGSASVCRSLSLFYFYLFSIFFARECIGVRLPADQRRRERAAVCASHCVCKQSVTDYV